MKKIIFVLLLSFSFLQAANFSWMVTAEKFLKKEKSYQSIYLIGALDSHINTLNNAYGKNNRVTKCIQKYKPYALVKIVKRFIRKNPKKKRHSAAKVVAFAIDKHCRR